MPLDRHGYFDWPGIVSLAGATYSVSHGITPGQAVCRYNPQVSLPSEFGDLQITDNYGSLTLRDCKVDEVRSRSDGSGTELELIIADRRWKWRGTGAVRGDYNLLDPHGKLIPWTIRSPYELAEICLQLLGERRYSIDMPPGLAKKDGQGLNAFVGLGVNFPPTGTNPECRWQCEPVAAALQALCDRFGRRIVYDPLTDRVSIVRLGIGGSLPDGSISSVAPGIKAPAVPVALVVYGDPTKYEVRLTTEPTGEEWDGSVKPINALSYTPILPEKKQVTRVTFDFKSTPAVAQLFAFVKIVVSATPEDPEDLPEWETDTYEAQTSYEIAGGVTNADAAQAIADALDTEDLEDLIEYEIGDGIITIRGIGDAQDFSVEASLVTYLDPPNDGAYLKAEIVTPYRPDTPSWANAPPPLFPGVKATDRLTLDQARALAQKSVWRDFQITGIDVTKKGKVNVPGFGLIKQKWQLELTDSRVVQVKPEAADETFMAANGTPLIVNYYNGYSKDMPAAAFGAIARWIQGQSGNAILKPGGPTGNNTPEDSQIHVPFGIDPVFQRAQFSACVYRHGPGGQILDPRIVIQTGVYVRNFETNALERYMQTLPVGGKGPVVAAVRSDVQLNIHAEYNYDGTFQKPEALEQDPIIRARYYLLGMACQYQLGFTETRVYNGIEPISVDGAIQQVTWTVGESGATTQASLNAENHPYIPPYPARRRAENQPATNRSDKAKRAEPGDPGYVAGGGG